METITITVDGRELTCNAGDILLSVALKAGIDIPHLCFEEDLGRYGACSLCVVEVEGRPKLMRACATTVWDGMVVQTNTPRTQQVRKVAMELLMADHTGDCKGPCELECPAHTDAQGYLRAIREGNDREAVRIVKETNPLPASIGRVCPHPCEGACRRGLVEQPLSIAFLKAFAADNDMNSANPFVPEVAADTGKKVAIVGGGPAGLAAAYRLRVAGHAVDVYDAMPEMGGMLRYGIPEYRLPAEVLAREVAAIETLGVGMHTGVRVGTDVTLDALRSQADAVLIAVGAWKAGGVRCPGEDLEGVVGGIDFLREVNEGTIPNLGKRVAVVGGGNTAMDACRTALRCGAEEVYVVYRRTREQAPAEDMEIQDAIDEGVVFKWLTNPAEIQGEGGHVTNMKLQIMELGEPDASGRRRPVAVEGAFEDLPVDTVIAAIGQAAVLDGFEQVEANKWGWLVANPTSGATNLEGVFAAGDVTNDGASIAIDAIAEGNRAAAGICAYLAGYDLPEFEPYWSKTEKTAEDFADEPRRPRAEMPKLDATARARTFDEVIKGFSEEDARGEADRCLRCGCHDFHECSLIRCANLQAIQPERLAGAKHAAYKERKLVAIERDQGKCILCDVCVRTCKHVAGKGLLGLVNRGSHTVIAPEFANVDVATVCADCHLCVDRCPTGALKLL
ncbi:MAG: FAD-dependent oxidoreductase [Coriobacteriia bacterium]|nr:FAD-dependent oxidoreductase [Coriobacteriia bacterium]